MASGCTWCSNLLHVRDTNAITCLSSVVLWNFVISCFPLIDTIINSAFSQHDTKCVRSRPICFLMRLSRSDSVCLISYSTGCRVKKRQKWFYRRAPALTTSRSTKSTIYQIVAARSISWWRGFLTSDSRNRYRKSTEPVPVWYRAIFEISASGASGVLGWINFQLERWFSWRWSSRPSRFAFLTKSSFTW